MAIRDRGPKFSAPPMVRRYEVRARDRGAAILTARDLAWEEALWVVGHARVAVVRSGSDGHDFVVTLPCIRQD
jgi:hypothetical protein